MACALDALADKGRIVRDAAQYGLDALFATLSPEALVVGLLPAHVRYLSKDTGKWQGTVGALKLTQQMADKAKRTVGSITDEAEGNDVLRGAMGMKLAWLIPVVEDKMHDLKPEVEKQAVYTMTSIMGLLSNDGVAPRIPLLIDTMQHPSTEALQKAILALSQTFIAVVTSPVLALLTPVLERSLNSPTATQDMLRETVIVIENLTKLVHDPTEARNFLPKLEQGIRSAINRAWLPVLREVSTRVLSVMDKAMRNCKNVIERTTAEDIAKIVDSEMENANGIADDIDYYKMMIPYISQMVAEDVNLRRLDRIPARIAPYIKPLMQELDAENTVAMAVQKAYIEEEDHRKFGEPPKEDGGEIEIVNADFSLGYGGILLLSHTNLRLLKGHRYGLVGPNGAGKSTLMRSIADGKLEGFPPSDVLRAYYVGHIEGEDADMSILEYLCEDPKITENIKHVSKILAELGITPGPERPEAQNVGSLSGGNKMKLSLARAMLKKPDVLLLDEPTNHLDVVNIEWLEEYLKSSTITCLIVSHDYNFLDKVTTDICSLEPNKKLAHLRGNITAFVRSRPEMNYDTLSTTNIQFRFLPPGILTGVKSRTRAIMRINNVSYTYPSALKPALVNISCHLTLSSRVAIVGPNGAGKSTLIKLMTGELVPTTGKVEQHPNLRIGYIKQHALEHLEMHLEKTPNQYIQWRYAYGDDREVHYKQTRLLSSADRAQLDTAVDIGDGNGARKIEALMGRQKHLKSFKYEVYVLSRIVFRNPFEAVIAY